MKLLIVEDEAVAARRVMRLVNEILEDDAEKMDSANSLEDAREFITTEKYDIVLLDLNLNGDDGFSILREFSTESFLTIVVSANTDRAIEAFELGVLDFIGKPVEKDRLEKAFARFMGNISSGAERRNLVIKNMGKVEVVPVKNIKYLKGAGDYSEIHIKDGTLFLDSKSLTALCAILPDSFERIHKSYVVNSSDIESIITHGGGKYECVLSFGDRLPVSRSRYQKLLKHIQ